MTECERIVEEGTISKNFLKPEIICDFYVDAKRKKLWAVLIDLLVKFDFVCRKYDLKYWVAFGGLLGIVRHNGFIPWDDDLDVCMPRDDYQELMRHAKEFEEPFFLQVPIQDKGYYFSFMRLRNSNTAAISTAFAYQGFNQGCFLDIFPLDNCCKDDMETNAQIIKELLILNSTNMKRSNPNLSESDKIRLIEYPYSDPQRVFEKIEEIATAHNMEDSDYVGTSVITFYSPEKMCWKKSDIFPLSETSFYGHKVFIPHNSHNVLTQTYNSYMEFPPLNKRGTWHSGIFIDPDLPFTNYNLF